MSPKPPWTPWHRVVGLREDVRTGELSLAAFAADLHDVVMQKGARPVYEDPARFFALTYPTFSLRELARDVVLRLAGQNDKAIRQLELTYGGGKTHTLTVLRHLVHDPQALPSLPAVEQFKSHIGIPLPTARIAALCFDKLDVEKGMEVRDPEGNVRWLKHPWSILAFQLTGADGLRVLHAEGREEERETPPAEPLLVDLLSRPQSEGLSTLVLIDEVLMYAREKAMMDGGLWTGRLIDFFQYLCQAVVKVDRCALIASILASDPKKSDRYGKELMARISEIFSRQKEEGVQPVQKEDVAEVLRRRFFEPTSIADLETFRAHVTVAVANIAAIDPVVRKDRKNAEERFLGSYPFHPDLTDIFYTRWTQLDGFQRTRGILRTFALALRDAEKWDESPLIGTNVFLPAPERGGISEAARELTSTATREITENSGNDWTTVLDGELEKARAIQTEHAGLRFREMEQVVFATFLSSQPIGQKVRMPDLMMLTGATRPDRIEMEKGLRRWMETSWFLDEAEFGLSDSGGDAAALPKAWRLGNRPNLKQMHHDACANRVSAEAIDRKLLEDVRQTKSLTTGASGAGARVHILPEHPRDIADDGDFRFAILGPSAVSDSGKPSTTARRFVDQTTTADRPRRHRNAILLVAPSRDGLEAVRSCIRDYLGWQDVRDQIRNQPSDILREKMLADWTEDARRRIPEAIRQAWSIVVTVNQQNEVHAFKIVPGAESLFSTVKADRRSRIQDTPISAEAMLPGGPYDLWREGEASRRMRTLSGAFAENPKLPKMLRQKEIADTIDRGVRDGFFVASLVRPDKSVKTWWRVPLDEQARKESALEIFLSEKAVLSDLDPNVLVPNVLPDLWMGDVITVADAVQYFENAQVVMATQENYEEPVGIPQCPPGAVKAAIKEAVRQGILWLLNGPASFQGETLPSGILTDAAQLRAPMPPLRVEEILEENVLGAWQDGRANASALLTVLSTQRGHSVPWTLLSQAIDSAIKSRWLELAPDSDALPCDATGAARIILRLPAKMYGSGAGSGRVAEPPAGKLVALEASNLQDFVDVLPDILEAAVGLSMKFQVRVVLEPGQEITSETRDAVNALLAQIHADLHLNER